MREIVTLQLGHLSNYVATHFWNTQESYFTYSADETPYVDHDVHWRAGIGADGSETFLPRTVIYDLKGGFGSLRKINALYDVDPDADALADSLWPGKSVVHKQQPLEQSEYQQSLDTGTAAPKLTTSSVRYWSDFSRVYYHPKSLVQLYDYELHSSVMPFERFNMGNELFNSLDKEHEIVDRDWRPFVEECDRMEGIQVFASLDDAWGGFAAQYVEAMRDEYPKACIWIWGLQSPMLDTPRDKRQLRTANVAQALGSLAGHASTVVPLSLPEGRLPGNVKVDLSSTWHVSALLATAIESATLPSRLLAQRSVAPVNLGDLAGNLNAAGNQPLAGLKFAAGVEKDDIDGKDESVDLFNIGRSKDEKLNRWTPFGKVLCARGLEEKEDEDEEEDDDRKRKLIGDPVIRRYKTKLSFPLLDSFPQIYSDYATQESIPVVSSLITDKTISTRMKTLRSQIGWSIGVDEREALNSTLADVGDAYEDDWSSGSDDGDDDY